MSVLARAVIVVRWFVALLPRVHVFSSLYRTSGQRNWSGARKLHPERGGSAGAFECQPRHRSGPQQCAVSARPPPPQNGGEAAEDHGEQRDVAVAGGRSTENGAAHGETEAGERRRERQRWRLLR